MSLFPDTAEFQKIQALLGPQNLSAKYSGIGDDGHLIAFGKKKWALSTDASVEGVHFSLKWCSPEEALYKAIMANISDLNAMGATTRYLYLSLGCKKGWGTTQFKKFKTTLQKLERKIGFTLSGGDFTNSPKAAFFNITVLGPVLKRPLLRKNAAPGQKIYLTGTIGSSHLGLKLFEGHSLLKKGDLSSKNHKSLILNMKNKHLFPTVPFTLGPFLSEMNKKIAAIDTSDGLSSELVHLSKQSHCRMNIEWENLPLDTRIKNHLSPHWQKKISLGGGEDYQLLFTGKFTEKELQKIHNHIQITEIGWVSKGNGVYLYENGKKAQLLKPMGYAH